LRSFHRKAPFLFFNGNTFAELARTRTDALFAEFPRTRRREAASLAAHYGSVCLIGTHCSTPWQLCWRRLTSNPGIACEPCGARSMEW
jgi:hypothetical protein